MARDCDLSDAAVIFQTQQVEEQADRDAVGRLHERLRSRLADPVVQPPYASMRQRSGMTLPRDFTTGCANASQHLSVLPSSMP